jgi:hypothetical protein
MLAVCSCSTGITLPVEREKERSGRLNKPGKQINPENLPNELLCDHNFLVPQKNLSEYSSLHFRFILGL